ncbi:MAG: hypothetical protein ACOZIN_04065 [Myxococcota bacterium]
MPSILLQLTAIERVATAPEAVPAEVVRALAEDPEYARFGAALLDLPKLFHPGAASPFDAPGRVAMGLKMAELVATGALVGKEPGLAFVSGYFTHLSLARVLSPAALRLAERHRRPQESFAQAVRRIEWQQGLFYLRARYGTELVGTAQVRAKLQILKRPGWPHRGVGRGLYELVRLSAQEAQGLVLRKREVDGWVRALYLYGLFLGSPLGKARALRGDTRLAERELYRGPQIDFPAEVERGLDLARSVLTRLASLIRRGRFTARVTAQFLERFPEESGHADGGETATTALP